VKKMSPLKSTQTKQPPKKSAAQSIAVKYVFLDIVSYSSGRSVEAQTDIIAVLNDLVHDSVAQFKLAAEQLIYLPTGDGICIALLGGELSYDIHIQIALALLAKLRAYNERAKDEMRQFEIRIGINANVDNFVIDVNGNRNVAGSGINIAQRIMNAGDGNQILVGDSVFDTLRYREKYMKVFKSYLAEVKHGVRLRVHQLVHPSEGLNTSVPTEFASKAEAEAKLTEFAAYYFAHCIRNAEFIKKRVIAPGPSRSQDSCVALFYMLALDSAGMEAASDIRPYDAKTWGTGTASLAEQFEFYDSLDFWLITEMVDLIDSTYLSTFDEYFESTYTPSRHLINKEGQEKLRTEWPAIWNKFDLGNAH
jgi:class 3 adenylate cyclase